MSITDLPEGGKGSKSRTPADLLVILILILSLTAAFGLGFLTAREMGQGSGGDKVWIEELEAKSEGLPAAVGAAPKAEASDAGGKYVASKTGTKYHLPTCSGAKRINEENKVWFSSTEEAKAAGYTPATNCPGL